MNFLNTAIEWLKNNKMIAIIGAAVIVFLVFGKKLFRTTARRRRRIPRSVGVRRRTVRRSYSKGGKAKKPWQVKGSLAAKRRMAQIRRKR